MKFKNRKKTLSLLKYYALDETIVITLTEQDTYTFDLEEVLDVAFSNNLGKIYNPKHYAKYTDTTYLFLHLCRSFISDALRNNKEQTTNIYKRHIKETEQSFYIENNKDEFARITIEQIILETLYDYSELFKLPLNAIHMNSKNRALYVNTKPFNKINLKNLKKELCINWVEDVINLNKDTIDVQKLKQISFNDGKSKGDGFSLSGYNFDTFDENISLKSNLRLFFIEYIELNDLLTTNVKDSIFSDVILTPRNNEQLTKRKKTISELSDGSNVYQILDFEFYLVKGISRFWKRKIIYTVNSKEPDFGRLQYK